MLLSLLFAVLATQDRLPIPDEAARKQAEKLVREIFKEEYAKGPALGRADFARKLFKQASETKGDAPTCYALFSQAEDMAILAGEQDLAWKVADEFCKVFQLDVLARKEAVLQRLPIRSPEDARRAAQAGMGLGADLISAGEFERAEKAGAAAAANAKKAKDATLAAQGDALAKEGAALKAKFRALPQARQTLETKDDDAGANALVGRFDCFVRGKWESGLPRLAKSGDPALQAAAQDELSTPKEALRKVAIGDAWSAVGEKETGTCRLVLLRHAGEFYRGSLADLTGLPKLKVERRLEEIQKEAGSAREVNLIGLLDMKEDLVKGTWSVNGSSLVCVAQLSILEIPYTPPEEYDLRLTVERKSGSENFLLGVVVGGRQCAFGIDEAGDLTGFGRIDGQKSDQNGTGVRGKQLTLEKDVLLVAMVRKTGVTLLVGGKKVVDWKGEASRLSRNPATPLRRPDLLYLASTASQFEIKKMVLVPLSGDGKRLRP